MKKLSCLLLTCFLILSCVTVALASEPVQEIPVPREVPATTEAVRAITVNVPAHMHQEQELTTELSQELTQLAARVRSQLGFDESQFTDFRGHFSERNNQRIWHLTWQADELIVSVDATPTGEIYSFHHSPLSAPWDNSFAPRFSQFDSADVEAYAEAFLRRLLPSNETARIDNTWSGSSWRSHAPEYSFSGVILRNNIETPFRFGISVDTEAMQVTSFWRDGINSGWRNYIGGFPSAVAGIGATEAQQLLNDTVDLHLGYFLTDAGLAELQYHAHLGQVAVDAQTGELIDTFINIDFWRGGGSFGFADVQALGIEEQAALQLEGLLSQAQLQHIAQNISGINLQEAELIHFSFQPDWHTNEINFANFFFSGPADAQTLGVSAENMQLLEEFLLDLNVFYDITLDARNGDLISFSSWTSYVPQHLITLEEQDRQAEAAAFLEANFAERFAQTVFFNSEHGFYTFVKEVDGFPFANNSFSVRVNPFTGNVESFFSSWHDAIEFQTPGELIEEEQARQTILGLLTTQLAFIEVPAETEDATPQDSWDTPQRLKLVYRLQFTEEEQLFQALDAHSGEKLYREEWHGTTGIEYDDLEDLTAANRAIIEKLGEKGIGFFSRGTVTANFLPQATLTEADMLRLLLSSGNINLWLGSDDEALDALYNEARWLGIFNGPRNPEREISRGEYIRTIISMSGYGRPAAIPGIFQTSFNNAASIPSNLFGYIAIAQGLGMLPERGNFDHSEILTREEAAVILYHFMDRNY